MPKRKKKNTFSWKRALGITSLKKEIARATGIPMTKAGRKRKFEQIVTKSIFSKKGLLFWIFIGWWLFLIFWAVMIVFFPITLPIYLVKRHQQKKMQFFTEIDRYYDQNITPKLEEHIAGNLDKKSLLYIAEQFKMFFDKMEMPKDCQNYYLEKYESILKFTQEENIVESPSST